MFCILCKSYISFSFTPQDKRRRQQALKNKIFSHFLFTFSSILYIIVSIMKCIKTIEYLSHVESTHIIKSILGGGNQTYMCRSNAGLSSLLLLSSLGDSPSYFPADSFSLLQYTSQVVYFNLMLKSYCNVYLFLKIILFLFSQSQYEWCDSYKDDKK